MRSAKARLRAPVRKRSWGFPRWHAAARYRAARFSVALEPNANQHIAISRLGFGESRSIEVGPLTFLDWGLGGTRRSGFLRSHDFDIDRAKAVARCVERRRDIGPVLLMVIRHVAVEGPRLPHSSRGRAQD